ncbi:MAG: hypothetical protein DMF82_06195 [Acidobacteria bacterium]|nr:MAG: hypothetical protein DMF82_06195 [Acidobacteriota bacterium]
MSNARPTEDAIRWLLEGDPAIRWQTLRDLAGASDRIVERERRRVARDGWGARLLARQDRKGTWAAGRSSDGLYSPKWISTTYTMLLLRDFGLPPGDRRARKACRRLLDGGRRSDGGVRYGTWARWTGRGETCVTGMILSILSYFEYDDERLDTVAGHLLERQMPDGGWNCRRPAGATHASLHTTILALEGLRHYEMHRGRKAGRVATSFWIEDRIGISPPVFNLMQFGRYPLTIYDAWVRVALSFVIPFAFASFYPTIRFLHREQFVAEFWLVPLVAAISLGLALSLWTSGVARYHSTGS